MKILYISPHLSTGGCPQFLLKKIQVLHRDHEIHCIEYADHGRFTVQKNQIKEILGDKLYRVNDRKEEIIEILNRVQPDIVHLEEMPEYFMDKGIALKLYRKDRKYKIIETSHDSSFDPKNKAFFPDRFMFVSKYQEETMKVLGIPSEVCEYPIGIVPRKNREEALKVLGLDPDKKHIVHVGLFTPRKNQAEIIQYAKLLINHPIQFHFVGNQADNFRFYWEPLMKDFPKNCRWWDERKDVDNFYQAADLFLFPSKDGNGDKETSPLVIREAISYNIPSLIYNSPVYMGMYDKYDNINYLNYSDAEDNCRKILQILNLRVNDIKTEEIKEIFYTSQGELPLSTYNYPNSMIETVNKYGDAAAMYWGTFLYKELDRFDVKVESGDIFVDLGSNIGISSRYAIGAGAKEVYCFEPDPKMRELLQQNVPSAKIFPYAISNKNIELELYHWPYNPVNVGPKYKVQTKTLKDVIDMVGKPIDYLKVDIESFEENLLDNISTEDLRKIKKMFIEHHNPSKMDNLCNALKIHGYDVNVENGYGQSYIYATRSKNKMYIFNSRWDLNEQKMYYSCNNNIDFPITVALREYQSNAVIWSAEYDSFPANCEFWMVPVSRNVRDYSSYEYYSGIKLCIYIKENQEQIYEKPFHHRFVNMPFTALSNKVPYYMNYLEYFVEKRYARWFDGKKFQTAVDVGANIGVFTEYLIKNKIARKIVAVECDKTALRDLVKNYEFNDNVTIIDKGLNHCNEPLVFYHCPQNSVISSTISPDNIKHHRAGVLGNVKTIIETVTIQDIVDKLGHIDLLKIDIEGAEYKIIENIDVKLFDHIDNLFIECHFFEENYRISYSNLIEKLKNAGYTVEEDVVGSVDKYEGSSECIFAYKK